MEWCNQGIILSARHHGENSLLVNAFTPEKGRHAGLVRGTKSMSGLCQTGNIVNLRWRGRLEEHLGNYSLEMIEPIAAKTLSNPAALACLCSVCALIEYALLERDAHPELYYATSDLIEEIANDFCPASYVRWELNFLGELGYGLDLTECAATGSNDNLIYVSPKSGRAVSALAGEPYRDKLLSLPDFLLKNEFLQGITDAEILAGLALCGYFLEKNVFSPTGKTIPLARQRLSGIISRLAA